MRFLLLLLLMACPAHNGGSSEPAAGRGDGSGRDASADEAWERKPTNVLVLLLDDVGTNAVRVYDEVEALPRTPRIDKLARDGVLFRNAYSAPVCSAARAALLTGRLARRTGLGDAIADKSSDRLALSEVTIPEMLDSAPGSWSTAALGKWHLAGNEAPAWKRHALDQGFDRHLGSPANLGKPGPDGVVRTGYTSWEKLVNGQLSQTTRYATTDTVDDAERAIREMPEPWFTWVAFNGAHDPFHAPPAGLVKTPVSESADRAVKFRAMVESVDREIGRLLDSMEPEVLARTMVIVIGDNGTPPQVVPPPFNGRQAKFTLYEGGTNVPFIVSGAGVAARGGESGALVHVVDLFDTVAAVARADVKVLGTPSKPYRNDGHPLQPLLANPDAAWPREVLFTERFVPNGPGPWTEEQVAVRDKRFKYMEVRKGGKTERFLFDLKGRVDDGPNLLEQGALDERATEALTRLQTALEGFERLR